MNENKIHILWTSADPLTANNMVFMYATNSLLKGWWGEVHIIVWGAAVKLLCEDQEVRKKLVAFAEAGGEISACKRCAENMGLLETLEEIPNVKVYYVGERLTQILKSGEKFMSV